MSDEDDYSNDTSWDDDGSSSDPHIPKYSEFDEIDRERLRTNKIMHQVLNMTSLELHIKHTVGFSDAPGAPDKDVIREVFRRMVIHSSNNIYSTIVIASFENSLQLYAMKRLDELKKKHPEIEYLMQQSTTDMVDQKDENGSKALAEARRRKEETRRRKEEALAKCELVERMTDISALWSMANTGKESSEVENRIRARVKVLEKERRTFRAFLRKLLRVLLK